MLATLLKPSRITAPSAPETLAGTLVHLEITIFPTEQVEEFQNKFLRNTALFVLATAAAWSAVDLVAAVFFVWASVTLPATIAGWIFTIFFALVAVGFGGLAAVCMNEAFLRCKEMRWVTTPEEVPTVSPRIPKAARRTAMEIHQHLPGARFTVMSFEKDPFLFVGHRGQRYCIAHWDETFEDR